ncbi:hypothetical protein [Rhizomicrobium electricum]|uniref:DUF4350 domain-containing protein n=1 Tax=Rhizomicrobium electricum TaxID=480070 RepID=A0ABP3PIE3_9PROT|nr:hypothetical protein [Rhizomicrobium electricum]NIJ48731.1 hypothetical protein [Rhizomicrobium electricum]
MNTSKSTGWISGKMAAALVVVSGLALVAFLALSAYAPQFRTETAGRANVLSKSAIGYAGLKLMLEETGTSVWVSRSRERGENDERLRILTPDANSSGTAVAKLAEGGQPTLIVLPKWLAMPDYLHTGWVRKWRAYNPVLITAVLKGLDESTAVMRPGEVLPGKVSDAKAKDAKTKTAPLLKPEPEKPYAVALTGTPAFGASPFPPKLTIDAFQTVAGDKWEPVLKDAKGYGVLVRLKGTQTYVLSDPDLLNTAALKNEAVAAGALALIRRLPGGAGQIGFDVTLAGFDEPKSLLRSLFGTPFLAVTLGALLAAALMAFRALNRFGSPRTEQRSFAFGKRSLADNTAALIRVMGRGPGMAPRYAGAIRRQAAKALRGGRAEDAQWLDAVETAGRITPTYSELLSEAETVANEPALLKLAAKLHDWKSRIVHERR